MSNQRRSVWGIEPGEQRRPRAIHGLIAVLLLGLAEVIARLFSFPLTLPLPFGKRLLTWFSPATTVQAVGGMWFGLVFILLAGLLMNIPAALWTVAAYRTVGIARGWWFFASFVLGHGLPPAVLGAILLKTLSGVVVESRLFCKGWWA